MLSCCLEMIGLFGYFFIFAAWCLSDWLVFSDLAAAQ
jgi:hypothetical protein